MLRLVVSSDQYFEDSKKVVVMSQSGKNKRDNQNLIVKKQFLRVKTVCFMQRMRWKRKGFKKNFSDSDSKKFIGFSSL